MQAESVRWIVRHAMVAAAVIVSGGWVATVRGQATSTWLGGSGDWNDSSQWSTPDFPNNGGTTYDVLIDGGDAGTASAVTLNVSVSIDSLVLDAGDTLTHADARVMTIVGGGATNHGLWQLDALDTSGAATLLIFSGDQTLGGSGEMALSDDVNNTLRLAVGTQMLTHGSGHTIRGSGALLGNVGNMINEGTILADGATVAMTINPASFFTNAASGVLGGDGVFAITDGTLDNDGVIAPGLSPGTLTINGNVDNADTSVLDIEIAGPAEGIDADLLLTLGDFEVDGVIRLAFLSGAENLLPTDTIRIVDALTLSGQAQFDGLVFAGGSGGQVQVLYDEANGDVLLTGFDDIDLIPEPATGLLFGVAMLLAVRRRRRCAAGA